VADSWADICCSRSAKCPSRSVSNTYVRPSQFRKSHLNRDRATSAIPFQKAKNCLVRRFSHNFPMHTFVCVTYKWTLPSQYLLYALISRKVCFVAALFWLALAAHWCNPFCTIGPISKFTKDNVLLPFWETMLFKPFPTERQPSSTMTNTDGACCVWFYRLKLCMAAFN